MCTTTELTVGGGLTESISILITTTTVYTHTMQIFRSKELSLPASSLMTPVLPTQVWLWLSLCVSVKILAKVTKNKSNLLHCVSTSSHTLYGVCCVRYILWNMHDWLCFRNPNSIRESKELPPNAGDSLKIHPTEESVVIQTLNLAKHCWSCCSCNKHSIHRSGQRKYGLECSFNQFKQAGSPPRPVLPKRD